MKSKEHAKKISSGEYVYRGFRIHNCGYYEPEHKVIWEGIDEETGEGIARGFSKRQVMREIDYSLDGR